MNFLTKDGKIFLCQQSGVADFLLLLGSQPRRLDHVRHSGRSHQGRGERGEGEIVSRAAGLGKIESLKV